MKVIIQNVDTKEYLSADGSWIGQIADARDFLTLLRAYHFGREKTSRNFQVVLYCPDDAYSASIISGVGAASEEIIAEANTEAMTSYLPVETAVDADASWSPRIAFVQHQQPRFALDFSAPRGDQLN